jgi:hypothetical protein
MKAIVALLSLLSLCACRWSGPITAEDVKHFTAIELCPAAGLQDLTSTQELDTWPGFSYHIKLTLDDRCEASYFRQLADLGCSPQQVRTVGCAVEDDPKTEQHTSIMVSPLGSGHYDMRFYE